MVRLLERSIVANGSRRARSRISRLIVATPSMSSRFSAVIGPVHVSVRTERGCRNDDFLLLLAVRLADGNSDRPQGQIGDCGLKPVASTGNGERSTDAQAVCSEVALAVGGACRRRADGSCSMVTLAPTTGPPAVSTVPRTDEVVSCAIAGVAVTAAIESAAAPAAK